MSMLPWHLAIARPSRRSLLDRLLRRDPKFYMDLGCCTECGAAVERIEPTIEEGEERVWYEGGTRIVARGTDSIQHFTLVPCGHKARRFSWFQQGYESIGLNDALAEAKRDA